MNFFRGILLQQALLFITIFFLPSILMAQTSSIEKVSLQLGWKHQFQYAGFYIAKEYGFYQDVDLDVSIKEFEHSIDIVNEVVSGHANFGIGKSSLLIERYNGKPIVALGALYQSSPSVLITTNPSIKTIKDIRGKKIMVTEDAVRSASISSMLLSSGINGNDFILQKHSFNLNDLIEDNTDAMASYLSNEPFYLEKKNIPYQLFNPKDYGYNFYGDILFSSEKELAISPERVRKFYAASKKGWLWAFDNIEKTAQLIFDKYNTQNKSLESLIYEGQALKALALVKGIDFGHISINKFNQIAEVFRLGNLLDKEGSLNGFVDPLNLNRTQIKIGVLAERGIEATLKRWTPLTKYLNTKLEHHYFTVLPLDFNQLSENIENIENNKIHFFITNPLNYVQLEHLYGASRIATLLNSNSATQDKFSKYGGVIFTNYDKQNINSIEDIKGKSFAAVDKQSFGGWIMAYEELITHGVTQDDIKISYLKTHDAVVNAVIKGQVESGTVRTDTLERMVKEGTINLSDIKVLNAKNHKDFPYLVSTQLYPEWPFSKLMDTSNKLANEVLSALLNIQPFHKEFEKTITDDWTVPLDYNAVHALLKKLHISPYDLHEINLVNIFKKYALVIYAITLGLILLIFRLIYINKLNSTLDGYNLKLDITNRELAFQNKEKDKRADELALANIEKDKRADELALANIEKEKQANELALSNLANIEKEKRVNELALAANVFTHARESIMITDAKGNIIKVNDTFTSTSGYSSKEAIGKKPLILQSGRQSPEFYADLWQTLLKEDYWSGEIWNKRKNGEVYAVIQTISAVRDKHGITTHYVSLANDITPMKAHQKQLEHIAHYDLLTNLPNRVLLADRLSQAMLQCGRHEQSLAVVFLDLDGFKAINDTYGHDMGDELLIALSIRMKEALREGDSLARIGGDEFVAVLTDLSTVEDSEPVLERLLLSASEPVTIGDIVLSISASIGVTLYPQDSVDVDQLMRHADQAMYVAKESGKNRYHLFDTAQDDAVKVQRESLEAIRSGLDNHQFVLNYQPKVNMRTGIVTGFEALIRWQHPERGLLNPIDFLPVIENNAMSIEVGEWVIDRALTQISLWQTMGLKLPISTSVNIAAVQLQQTDFVDRLKLLLAAHPDVEPRYLELEVLETTAIDDVHHVSTIMNACIELGVNFALDDFGTGYSSLTYLRRLPASIIKIDQTFVRDMLHDSDDLAIVEGVIALAKSFKRDVIAEGVETIEHGTVLLQLGCDLAQGYGIARPMPASDIPTWVNDWKPDVSWQTE